MVRRSIFCQLRQADKQVKGEPEGADEWRLEKKDERWMK